MTGFSFSRHWGTEIDEAGVRARLWAPALESVSLISGAAGETMPMEAAGDGWFETHTGLLKPSDPYGYRLPDGTIVPDPAARAQIGDVHGRSRLVDPNAYQWKRPDWRGRPWSQAVILELHTGTFTPQGTFAGVASKLGHIRDTGITAIELMPVAQFGGSRGWGYDGVMHYAPHNAYGSPDDLKTLIDAAHERELMVLLDVVYNHFGPDGNYLNAYAPDFFNHGHSTPWGTAIAYERQPVRDFFVDNALYWLEEYRFDGLRLDAVNEIRDPSDEHLLETIAHAVRDRITDREIHLTTEDDRNITRLHERDDDGHAWLYTGEWNDDFHHTAHVIATGESEGYYIDYSAGHTQRLARALAQGYVYQGEPSAFWDNTPRGVPSAHLPPVAMVNFLQNHDQIGNRAYGERLSDLAPVAAVEALTAILLLSPQIPMLFMGEEWGETASFCFFTDFDGELAEAVREGRRREFARFARFCDPDARRHIPDPNALSTFEASRLDWEKPTSSDGSRRHALVKRLLDIRRRKIVPRLSSMSRHDATAKVEDTTLAVTWRMGDGALLMLNANLGDEAGRRLLVPKGDDIFTTEQSATDAAMPPWAVVVSLDAP